ncbi:MAG TPA: hypothetical protein VM115_03850 [Vicinamibacterales bacterium]|nr:hypothetical protein [Vicinamibacterales bacterium]
MFATLIIALSLTGVWAQGSLYVSRDHPAIQYSSRAPREQIVKLNESIAKGDVSLAFDPLPRGYLASVLKALDIPPSSQTLVFSENSLQRAHISKAAPRAVYFNDTVAVAWAKGAETIEVTALDPTQGVHFYSLPQRLSPKPQLIRRNADCLQCHLLPQTHGVPGVVTMSVLPLSDNKNDYAQGWDVDHRTPIEDRWGGWYVTGAQVPAKHLGNVPVLHVPKSYVRADVAPKFTAVSEAFDAAAHLTPHSDVVAMMVLNHQTRMTNLLTRLGWQSRIAAHEAPKAVALPAHVRDTAIELVDYMLFVEEAPLPTPVRGLSSFTNDFPAKGPRDSKGRSLRDLDLTRRLLRYPCSYMIYTEAFDALPPAALAMVYERMWAILSGKVTGAEYAKISAADRRAIIEILRETKKNLPAYWRG